jgi:hypothetical protein
LNTPADPIQSFAGEYGRVYGWGLVMPEEFKFDSKLHHVDVPFVDQVLCNSTHTTLPTIMSDTSFCAGARDRTGPCNGKMFFKICLRFKTTVCKPTLFR